ncbi:hypothetical protein LJR234_006643 [Mesorhizobium amorphae]|uniref:hypothetical protein n=1 Tax=Mesorhizobium amorphae TaxID=71433 RepID=UPI003ECF6CF4
MPAKARRRHVGGTHDQATAAPADLQKDFGMENTSCSRAADAVKAPCVLRQSGCTVEGMGEHAAVGQQYIVAASGPAQAWQHNALERFKVDPERACNGGVKVLVGKALIKFH